MTDYYMSEFRGDKHEIKLSENETTYYLADICRVEFSRGHLIVTSENKQVAIYAPGAWKHYRFVEDVHKKHQRDFIMNFMTKGETK